MGNEFKLMPCPFCGSAPELVDDRLQFFVRCTGCMPARTVIYGDNYRHLDHVEGSQEAIDSVDWEQAKQSAVERWNKRAQPAEQHQGEPRQERCDTCHGLGEVATGTVTHHGYNQPPEPDLEVCPECSGEQRWYVAGDIDRLARELDVLLNGDGAAPQAKLCDLVAQVAASKKHQGEPVAMPERKQPRNSTNADWYGAIGWNACLDEIAKLGPLYTRPAQGEPVAWEMDDTAGESGRILVTNDTRVRDEWVRNELPVAPLFGHADPGEVERLREGISKHWKVVCDQRSELDTLRAQLAERNELLEDWHTANATGEVKVSDKAYRIVTRTAAALSASAEPSAPVAWHVGGNGYDRICFEEPRDLPGHPCVQAISDQRQLISLLKRYNLRDEEQSAPVGRADPVREALRAFVGAAYPVANQINERGHNWSEAYLDEALELARAALERKP